jgi:hypothetical protein
MKQRQLFAYSPKVTSYGKDWYKETSLQWINTQSEGV